MSIITFALGVVCILLHRRVRKLEELIVQLAEEGVLDK